MIVAMLCIIIGIENSVSRKLQSNLSLSNLKRVFQVPREDPRPARISFLNLLPLIPYVLSELPTLSLLPLSTDFSPTFIEFRIDKAFVEKRAM